MSGAMPSLTQYVLMLWCLVKRKDKFIFMMKFSLAIRRVKWLSGEKTNVSKTISVLILRVLGRMFCEPLVFTAQPFDPAYSPRELHHTQSPGKQQISNLSLLL
jgi:hypothetical protein